VKVGLVGSGTMGRALAQLFSQCADVDSLIWKGRTLDSVGEARDFVLANWQTMVDKKRSRPEDVDAYRARLRVTDRFDDLRDIDIAVEAVPEEMAVKKAVFQELDRVAQPGAVLATNTSSLSIRELAGATRRPEQVIGLHFFNPALIMKLVEVVVIPATSPATTETARRVATGTGKTPVIVRDAPGFIVNRMLIPMINEAVGILAQGIASADDIDKAMRFGANHPIGPLTLADLIGNDVVLSILETLHCETGDPKYQAHSLLSQMVREGRLGRKTGKGFFEY
jgi:3-hydroxybutyryl-CoA dehydrogenase